MNEELFPILQNIGFNEKESKVYIALSELGNATVTQIALRSKLKRSITYVILEDLIKKGFASIVPGTKVNLYAAENPQNIFSNFKDRINSFKDALPIFLAIYNKSLYKPKISYYEGKEGVLEIYNKLYKEKPVYYITSLKNIAKYLPDEVESWLNSKKDTQTNNKHLYANTDYERNYVEKKIKLKKLKRSDNKYRFLPPGLIFDINISLFGDNKVELTCFENHLFSIVIESKAVYNSMKTIFDLLWQQGVK